MLAAYVQGCAFLNPHSVGLESRVQGFLEGFIRTGKICLLVILTLAVAAVYEVIEVVILIEFMQ